MTATTPPRITPGALVLGGLGLVAFVVSLVVPWVSTVTFVGLSFEEETTDALSFGLGSVLYLIGVMLVAGLAVVTLVTRGTAREVLGMSGLAACAVPVAALIVVAFEIRKVQEVVLGQAAEIDRESNPDMFASLQAGPVLGGLAVYLLAIALTRFAWPDRATVGYATASLAAVLLALVLPWASREAIFADRVTIVDYWFPHTGVPGTIGACMAVLALASCVLTFVFAERAWWPPLLGLVGALGSMIAVSLVGDDNIAADPRLTDASYTDEVVNSGFPALCALVGLVMFASTLVTAIRAYRAARRAAPPRPAFLPPPDHPAPTQWW